MKAIALACVIVLASSCGTYRTSKAVAKGGGYTMLAGAAFALAGGGLYFATRDSGNAGYVGVGLVILGGVIATPGVVLAGSGLAGMAIYDDDVDDDDDGYDSGDDE